MKNIHPHLVDKLDEGFNNANKYGLGNKENDAGSHDDVP